jgi:ABC-type polysaccharide/polyol phosphate transport system ATPase subunit/SAM-dependent methyltransferase
VPVIDAQSVSKRFLLRHNASVELKVRFLGLLHPERRQSIEEFWALRGVSLRIDHGEAVGLVGRNGSGKSTFLKLIAAIHRPTTGRILVARGARISSMIELGVGFHPELTGRENVVLNAAIHGLTRAEIDRIYDAVVEYSGLQHFIDVPIKNYSSGMYMRLGFAISANLDPDILLLDEIFAVGDADFQQRCIGTVKRFMDEGKTIIFVSHAAPAIRAICRRVCVLEQGELMFDGEVDRGLAFYEELLVRRAAHADGPMPAGAPPAIAVAGEADLASADLECAPHRAALGGHWREVGLWQFELLRRQGLEPRHHVLEVGCGSLAAAVHLVPFLEESHYWGVERNRALLEAGIEIELARAGIAPERGRFLVAETFDLSEIPGPFDLALASSGFARWPFNDVARCIASVVRRLKPSGRFYAAWFENPDPASFDPIVHPNGVTTYPDREPYHYPFGLIAAVCEAVGATVHRIDDVTHPGGESVLVISRQPDGRN